MALNLQVFLVPRFHEHISRIITMNSSQHFQNVYIIMSYILLLIIRVFFATKHLSSHRTAIRRSSSDASKADCNILILPDSFAPSNQHYKTFGVISKTFNFES